LFSWFNTRGRPGAVAPTSLQNPAAQKISAPQNLSPKFSQKIFREISPRRLSFSAK
jgi:hypothetical protein